jgi:uncharacterized protein (DUF427 family)
MSIAWWHKFSAPTTEGNYYFPPSSLSAGAGGDSPTPAPAPWKSVAQYHDISISGSTHHDATRQHPHPYPSSLGRVGQDCTGYVVFDKRQVTIDE